MAFRAGLTLRFSCAIRAIIAGLIRLLGNTLYYRQRVVREEVVAMVILSYTLCFSLGACIGFAVAGFFATSSDKEVRPWTNKDFAVQQGGCSEAMSEKRKPRSGDTGAADGRTSGCRGCGVGPSARKLASSHVNPKFAA